MTVDSNSNFNFKTKPADMIKCLERKRETFEPRTNCNLNLNLIKIKILPLKLDKLKTKKQDKSKIKEKHINQIQTMFPIKKQN